VGCWFGYWALAKKSTSNQYDVNTHNQQYQAGLVSQERDRVQAYDTAVDPAQKQQIKLTFCQVYPNLSPPPADLVDRKSCPSIGFPTPTTAQLTNPLQDVGTGGPIGQLEPNGVYTGDSTGTYVVCVAPNGTKYVSYWEGDVQTEGGPAHWDDTKGQIVLDGAPTVTAKTK